MNNDLISREALKEALHNEIGDHALSIAIDRLIDKAPTVETSKIEYKAYNEGFKDGVDQGIKLSERPHGKWILCEDSDFSKCSICGFIWLNEECNNYCPNCGTYMRSENNVKK